MTAADPAPADARLEAPSLAVAPSYLEALREGHELISGHRPTADDVAAIARDLAHHLADLTDQSRLVELGDGRRVPTVPFVHFWLVAGRRYVGRANLRLALNDNLRVWGGHIGYVIRPSLRGRGFGTRVLALTLAEARRRGLTQVLLTCDDDNWASRRIIERNGGRLEDVVPRPGAAGGLARRYWISLA